MILKRMNISDVHRELLLSCKSIRKHLDFFIQKYEYGWTCSIPTEVLQYVSIFKVLLWECGMEL